MDPATWHYPRRMITDRISESGTTGNWNEKHDRNKNSHPESRRRSEEIDETSPLQAYWVIFSPVVPFRLVLFTFHHVGIEETRTSGRRKKKLLSFFEGSWKEERHWWEIAWCIKTRIFKTHWKNPCPAFVSWLKLMTVTIKMMRGQNLIPKRM